MTDTPDTPSGDRLAKVIARAGLASRRDAEQMIADLRVMVNGRTISSPATTVGAGDQVTVDAKPLPKAEAARVWLYHKPAGLVTTERDEKGRETVFDALRGRLGRVLSVGRLDLTSEGLLLLTNDGGLKRRLELPETGWLRRYRVRVNGTPDEAALQRLRDGIEIDGEQFQGMQVTFDRQQGANAWLTVGLREGRNREIRRAAEAVGLYVNRLIRVSYGPFQLGTLPVGEVEEVKPRILRDQLGTLHDGAFADARREAEPGSEDKKPRKPQRSDPRGQRGPGKPRRDGAAQDRGPRGRPGAPGPKGDGPQRARGPKPRGPMATGGDRPDRADRGPKRGAGPRAGGRPPRGAEVDASDTRPDRRPSRVQRDDRPKGREERAEEPRKTKMTKSERKAAQRADTSVSLRKGGQRGRGIAKAKPKAGKPYTKPPRGDR
ncbi:hypothetical protein JANAI62_13240 [Jannaschia pagri]|uniref:Pseudouridine synthase n=1 Tax=Jannaschia pagri TaxID=2829797 RepID=A0ABQ4NJV3_9RHOB|nr:MULTISPECIES: pseudouridine synthase [unclassified Jannaschia]GIT90870.1 hypothetical protein JANAI61_13280 [Jannaschia sp. AI_61]GIT94701.1 hypothetical protein JANAI62_13240 [Jannaschia sp. AI_62]